MIRFNGSGSGFRPPDKLFRPCSMFYWCSPFNQAFLSYFLSTGTENRGRWQVCKCPNEPVEKKKFDQLVAYLELLKRTKSFMNSNIICGSQPSYLYRQVGMHPEIWMSVCERESDRQIDRELINWHADSIYLFIYLEKQWDGTSAGLHRLPKDGSVYLFYQNICQTKPPTGLRFGNLVKLKGNSVSLVWFSFFFFFSPPQVYRNILSEEGESFIGRLRRTPPPHPPTYIFFCLNMIQWSHMWFCCFTF